MFEKIRNIICEQLGLDEDMVTEESTFAEDLHCDSLDVIELMTTAEEEFGMDPIPEEALAKMATVGDLVAYIENNGQEG